MEYLPEQNTHEFETIGYTWLYKAFRNFSALNIRQVSVEGNIATGKTTFIEQNFKDDTSKNIVYEPISLWRNYKGENLLARYYDQPEAYGFKFQECIYETVNAAVSACDPNKVVISERSCQSAANVFTPLMYHKRYITLQQLVDIQTRPQARKLGCCVYLYSEPQVAFERMLLRNRMEESEIGCDYIKQIHEMHVEWLIKHDPGFPVLLTNALQIQTDPTYSSAAKELNSHL